MGEDKRTQRGFAPLLLRRIFDARPVVDNVGAKHTHAGGCFDRTRSVICVGAILVIARIRLTWITKANTRFAPTLNHDDPTDTE